MPPDSLPDDAAALKALLVVAQAENERLIAIIKELQRHRFGPRSEKIDPDQLALMLLTILGAAGESLGMDRQLRTSTAKRRVHSLFRQGCLLYDLIPNMPEPRLRPLVERYQDLLGQNAAFSEAFGLA